MDGDIIRHLPALSNVGTREENQGLKHFHHILGGGPGGNLNHYIIYYWTWHYGPVFDSLPLQCPCTVYHIGNMLRVVEGLLNSF